MGTALKTYILDNYMTFLESLSPEDKLDLISKLMQSIKSEISPKVNLFDSAFGSWTGSESAEEIVKGIRGSRTFDRQMEGL